MATLYLLGTGAALSEPHRTTTMLALVSSDRMENYLVDCGGDVLQRYLQAGLPLDGLAGLILTHEHPDHVAGFPLLIEKLWLAGRRRPLPIYGPEEALRQARALWSSFRTETWEGLPALLWHVVPPEEGAEVLSTGRWHITAAPGVHGVPVIGLRAEARPEGTSVCYSSDTEPCASIARLAHGVNLLVHEATGKGRGHTSAEDAARIAREAQVGRLLLVHLPLRPPPLEEARRIFPETAWGEELGAYPLK